MRRCLNEIARPRELHRSALTISKMLAIAAVLLMSVVSGSECSLASTTANSQVDVCEPITVACPENVDVHSDINFKSFVTRAASSPRSTLQYHWSLRGFPGARIKSGQGTSSIVVSVPRRAGSLTATVIVTGITKGCPNKATCTTVIARRQ